MLSGWFLRCAHTLVVNLRIRSKDKYWQKKKKLLQATDKRMIAEGPDMAMGWVHTWVGLGPKFSPMKWVGLGLVARN